MTNVPDPSPKRRVPWLKLLLVVSLALNLTVLGVIGGALLGKERRLDRPDKAVRELGFGPYGTSLSRDQRSALRPKIGENRDVLRDNRRALREGLKDAIETLRADPFELTAFADILERQSQSARKLQDLGRKLLLEQVAEMSDAERADYAERLEKSMSRFGKRRDRK